MSKIRSFRTFREAVEVTPKDRLSAERMFREHGDWLRRRLVSRFGAEIAEEVVQDTWMRLVARGRLETVLRPKPFLIRVATNLLIDRNRREQVRPVPVSLDEVAPPSTDFDAQGQALLLKQILLGMPTPLRDVFLLNRFQGWTYQSIADHLNISVKTVEWRMSKALRYCAERLRD